MSDTEVTDTFQVALTKGGLCWEVLQSKHKIQTILDRTQSGQGGRDAVKHELKNMALPSPRLLATVAAKHLACQQQNAAVSLGSLGALANHLLTNAL